VQQSGTYFVTIANTCGTVQSSSATVNILTVPQSPVITAINAFKESTHNILAGNYLPYDNAIKNIWKFQVELKKKNMKITNKFIDSLIIGYSEILNQGEI
jgi:hypothetical protein